MDESDIISGSDSSFELQTNAALFKVIRYGTKLPGLNPDSTHHLLAM